MASAAAALTETATSAATAAVSFVTLLGVPTVVFFVGNGVLTTSVYTCIHRCECERVQT